MTFFMADMPFMRSSTTPVAPLWANAAAPSDDAMIAPIVVDRFISVFFSNVAMWRSGPGQGHGFRRAVAAHRTRGPADRPQLKSLASHAVLRRAWVWAEWRL
ncbi:hypothetical protein [Loktanella atrilutea]|uniref:hypothetical protein n=1 Tax=Loktanella atrilutea TaxID=366533 RepID=UPI0015B704DB|nr:hypothetical protein [Loktanella atrilutea]